MPTWLSPPGSEMPGDEKRPRHRIGRGSADVLDAVSVVARSKRQEDYSRAATPTPTLPLSGGGSSHPLVPARWRGAGRRWRTVPSPFQGEGAAIPLSLPGGEELAADGELSPSPFQGEGR